MENGNPGYQSFPTSYEAACRADQINHELAKVILESKEDIGEDNELFGLLKDYFDHGLKLLDFYTSLQRCLTRTRDSQLKIQLALLHYEEERGKNVGGERYVETLQELQKFKEAGDPFTDEFFELFQLVFNQQEEMLQKWQARKKKLDKNLKNARVGRMVTNAIFVTAFVFTLIFSVVAAKIEAPPVVTTLATVLTAPIGTAGKWCDSWWKNYQRTLNWPKELIGLMKVGIISIYDLETIRSLVDKLEIKIKPILQNVDLALGEGKEEAMKLVMLEIKKGVEAFRKTIEDLHTQADKSSHEIWMARNMISQRIIIGQSGR